MLASVIFVLSVNMLWKNERTLSAYKNNQVITISQSVRACLGVGDNADVGTDTSFKAFFMG